MVSQNKFWFGILCICVFVCLACSQNNCKTSKGKQGECMLLTRCVQLYDMTFKSDERKEEIKHLRDSLCGWQGLPKVCCPMINQKKDLIEPPVYSPAANLLAIPSIQSSCKTPKGEQGECMLLPRCKQLYNMSLNQYNTKEEINYLRNSMCGRQNSIRKVCCPLINQTIVHVESPVLSHILLQSIFVKGGKKADIRQFPWMALLEYSRKPGYLTYLCGGSLISRRYVVTAAHCIKGNILERRGYPINVHLGEYDTDNKGRDCVKVVEGEDCTDDPLVIPIEKFLPHPQYESGTGKEHDIALLRLSQNVEFTDFISPIRLPDSDRSSATKLKLFVAGWGATENEGSSPVKLFAALPLADFQSCQKTYGYVNVTLGDGQMCAGEDKGSCSGDSGAPLMDLHSSGYTLIGVTSFSANPCGHWPVVFTKTYKYVDWIKSNLRP